MTYAIDPTTGLPQLPEPYVWYVGVMHRGYEPSSTVLAIVEATEAESISHPVSYFYGSITNVERHDVPEVPGIPEHTVLTPVTRTRLFSGKAYTSMESVVIPEVPAVPGKVWYTYTELSYETWMDVPEQGELTDSLLLELSFEVLKKWEAELAHDLERQRIATIRESKFGLYPPKTLNS